MIGGWFFGRKGKVVKEVDEFDMVWRDINMWREW